MMIGAEEVLFSHREKMLRKKGGREGGRGVGRGVGGE